MKITKCVNAKKMNFEAHTPAGVMIRTVYVYIVNGSDWSCLIDTGVYPGLDSVLEFIDEAAGGSEYIREILITHAHTDHIGALPGLKKILRCDAAASDLSSRWIEDVELQFKERPVPHFHEFTPGPAKIEHRIKDGDAIELGGSTLRAYAAPGHEIGQMAFFHQEDGVLFSADCIPVPGEIPIYDNVAAEVESIRRLVDIENVNVLLMSWADPIFGAKDVRKAFADAQKYIKTIHNLTIAGIDLYGEEDPERVARFVHGDLGLPPNTYTKFFIDTVQAHIRERELVI